MELMLICIAVAYTLTGKFNKDTAQSAYKAGKEPPGLAKARLRHASGGGARKPNGKPTGKGATRVLLSQRWANACEKAKDRADDKHRRWRAWYAEQAPERDQQWRAKQAGRIAKSEQRAEKFARARGILAHPVAARQDRQERQAWDENARRDHDAGQRSEHDTDQTATQDTTAEQRPSDAAELDQFATDNPDIDNHASEVAGIEGDWNSAVFYDSVRETKNAREAQHASEVAEGQQQARTATETNTATTTNEGVTVYQQAAAKLHEHADEVEDYVRALTALGDDLEGIGWGSQVHGPLGDMHTHLSAVVGTYRDLAEQIKAQGDEVADAHDEAPWVPDAAVMA